MNYTDYMPETKAVNRFLLGLAFGLTTIPYLNTIFVIGPASFGQVFMLSTPHLFAGAAIVKLIPNPIISLPLAYLSHFLLDSTPHWDGSPKAPFGKMFFVLVALDYLFGVFLIWWLVQNSPEKFLILFGAFLGTAPDFLLGSYRNFPGLPWNKIPWYIKMNEWHRKIQRNIPPLGGLATGVLVVLISAWILFNFN